MGMEKIFFSGHQLACLSTVLIVLLSPSLGSPPPLHDEGSLDQHPRQSRKKKKDMSFSSPECIPNQPLGSEGVVETVPIFLKFHKVVGSLGIFLKQCLSPVFCMLRPFFCPPE